MDIILRAALAYVILLAILRITTHRVSRTMTPLDMVIVFLFGGLSSQAVLAGDQSITAAVIAVSTISLAHIAVSTMKIRWPGLGRVAEGTPSIVFANGQWDEKRLREMRIYKGDVLAEMRQRGISHLADVNMRSSKTMAGFRSWRSRTWPTVRADSHGRFAVAPTSSACQSIWLLKLSFRTRRRYRQHGSACDWRRVRGRGGPGARRPGGVVCRIQRRMRCPVRRFCMSVRSRLLCPHSPRPCDPRRAAQSDRHDSD
jgi:hypothetical protein